jgi:hypothetical protein
VSREVDAAATLAAEADDLDSQLRQRMEPALALTRIAARRDALDFLVALTKRVPGDSWAYDVEITVSPEKTAELNLSGFAAQPPDLIDSLEGTPEFEQVRLVSAVSAGVGTGQDRLELSAKGSEL